VNFTREPIFVALWNLITSHPTIQATFVQTARLLVHHSQVPGNAAGMPALYMIERSESHVRKGQGISDLRTLRPFLVMYFSTAQGTGALPATQCNNALDAIDYCINIPGNPANTQTLGGLVQHVYIEGEVTIDEGLLQETSVVVVPITIVIP
jgi:hypothetical protein